MFNRPCDEPAPPLDLCKATDEVAQMLMGIALSGSIPKPPGPPPPPPLPPRPKPAPPPPRASALMIAFSSRCLVKDPPRCYLALLLRRPARRRTRHNL